jgi:4-hydroxy-2-oxoheptanedioate aldolase
MLSPRRSVRETLAAGESVFGIIVFTGSPVVVEVAAASRLDFVILDMEHSALDMESAAHLLRAADAGGISAYVRIPGIDRGAINRLLNLGAAGIVLPHANRERCAELVSAMRYAPEGERGACQITRAAAYTRGNWSAYAAAANRDLMAIALIEDCPTLEDFEGLAELSGIDAYFVGPTDLSIALGVPDASFDDPVLGAALDRVVAATLRHGKLSMTLVGNNLDPAYCRRVQDRGVQMIVIGTDVDLLSSAIAPFRS